MKRILMASAAYLTAGVGAYYAFIGDSKWFGLLFLVLGILGILNDIFDKKLNKVY